jgi:spermidine synthase
MSEKFQYGQKVEYEIVRILRDVQTSKSHVQYVQTKYHGTMLLMDDEVQYSTLDEHRYHYVLTHPVISNRCNNILILGGGDGLAAKYLYASPYTGSVTIVDWDPEFVEFAKMLPENRGTLDDPRTILVYQDALEYVKNNLVQYDGIIMDLPDPDGTVMETLYLDIIACLYNSCAPDAVVTTHAGPVSLCSEHPCWDFITDCKHEMEEQLDISSDVSVQFDKVYVPSFSHEWAFLTVYTGSSKPYSRKLIDNDVRLQYATL